MEVPMTVTVYLNEATNFTSFDPVTAQLRKAATFDMDVSTTPPADIAMVRVLEKVFEQLNIDEPECDWAQRYRAERNRSLSVGDVVAIGESAWVVASMGWERISAETLAGGVDRDM